MIYQLPKQDELKTVVDKVKDFFGEAKESFGKLSSIDTPPPTEAEDKSKWVNDTSSATCM
mgnify:CR=1 FL=1